MTTWLLILRSLRHYWRTHLGVVLGAMVSTAVLVGALAVGDSVRHTLRSVTLARLGNVESAMDTGDRFFREALASEVGQDSGGRTAPALRLHAIAANSGGTARANNVQVLGVDARFWRVGGFREPVPKLAGDQVILNDRLAAQLGVRADEEVLIRVDKPGLLSRDAPLVPTEGASVAMRLTVAAIATDADFGRFSLRANQVLPYNAFLTLALLQDKLGLGGRANLVLSSYGAVNEPSERTKLHWRLTDIGVVIREPRAPSEMELRTDRVFLDKAIGAAAEKGVQYPMGILTYFVNEIKVGERGTPYSTATAIGYLDGDKGVMGLTPSDLADNEVVINSWLGDDLHAKPGDALEMTYFVIGSTRRLVEQTSRFRIRDIVPLAGHAVDPALMPDFPGVADVDNCRDWKPGMPIDLKKIRPKDEDYWKKYRGTPKAFITLAAGQKIWANRFGDLTAIRVPGPVAGNEVEKAILSDLNPADFGLVFRPVLEEALKASEQGLDFGQLFLGLSFFLIAAAVLLMGLLFVFGIEQRAGQVGLLLALGFTPRRVRRLMLAEGGLLALVGGVAGTFAGTLFTRAVIAALSGVWRGAVAGSAVQYHAETATLLMGGGIGVVVAVATMWLTLLRQARRPARELLTGGTGFQPVSLTGKMPVPPHKARAGRSRIAQWVGLASIAGAIAIVVAMGARRDQAAAMGFFGAGALLLIGGIALCYGFLSPAIPHPSPSQGEGRVRVEAGSNPPPAPSLKGRGVRTTLGGLGWHNATRRRGRSLAVVALLACAAFLVFAIGANRQDPLADAAKRSSGTGGFAFYGETALPVFDDLNSPEGRKAFALDGKVMRDVKVVPLRVHEGDDASCLNLNRAQQPRLLGVNPQELASRNAFTFVKTAEATDKPWLLLEKGLGEGIVPAIGDDATITWGLAKSVGDEVQYTDGHGQTRTVRIVGVIANSILQGSLLIAEDQFIRLFPSDEGYRAFLVDCPMPESFRARLAGVIDHRGRVVPDDPNLVKLVRFDAARRSLTSALEDVGLEIVPAYQRLAEFGTVENTYLSIFQALGGLAMLLGSVGLGVVVLRNVMERRNELALLRAVGFRKRALVWLVLSEHWGLLAIGLLVGTASAVIAVLPALRSPGADVPYLSLGLTLMAVAASGLVWTWLAAVAALRGPLLNALRNE